MQKVTEYLNRFLHLVPRDRQMKEVAADVLNETFPTIPGKVSIEFQNSILFINGSSALKHAIQLRKMELLTAINERAAGEKAKDIR